MDLPQLSPANRLPILSEISIVIFPFAPGWGAALMFIQLCLIPGKIWQVALSQPIAWVLGGISLWMFLTTAIAVYPLDAFLGLANFLPFFCFFLVYGYLLGTVERLDRLAWLVVIPSLGVALLGLGQLWGGWHTPPLIWHAFGWELIPAGNPPGRLASTFMYANISAAYLLMALFLGLSLWLKSFHTRVNRGFSSLLSQKSFIYLSVTLLVDSLALILTSSRNAWAIALLGSLVFALYIGWWWICLAAGAFTAAIMGASFGHNPWQGGLRKIVPYYFWGRLSDQMHRHRPVEDLRMTQWHFVTDMIRQRPWTGWGIRSFTPAYQSAKDAWLGHPHNIYLMIISEIGIPVGLLFIGTIGWVLAQGCLVLSRLQDPASRLIVLGYLVAFGGHTLFNVLDVTVLDLRLNFFAWLLLVAIWSLGQQVNQTRDHSQANGDPEQAESPNRPLGC